MQAAGGGQMRRSVSAAEPTSRLLPPRRNFSKFSKFLGGGRTRDLGWRNFSKFSIFSGGDAQGVWFLAVCRGPDRRHFNHFNGCGFAHGAFERRNFCIFCGRAYAHQDLPGEAKGTRDGTGWHFSATSTRRGVLVNDSAALCVHSLRIASWSEWHTRSCLKTCYKEKSAKALPERWIAPTALRCLLG